MVTKSNDTLVCGFIGSVGSGKSTLSGKVADNLSKLGITTIRYSMADPVKYIVYKMFNYIKGDKIDINRINSYTNEEMVQEFLDILAVDFDINFTSEVEYSIIKSLSKYSDEILDMDSKNDNNLGRRLMQLIGTEFGRNLFEYIWVDIFLKFYNSIIDLSGFKIILIDDIRFLNELESLSEIGGYFVPIDIDKNVILDRLNISENDLNYILNHPSENSDLLKAELENYENVFKIDNSSNSDDNIHELSSILKIELMNNSKENIYI